MANEKNNINELVSVDDDDDPTAELEVLTLGAMSDAAAADLESDAHTFNVDNKITASGDRNVAISNLESDLQSRSETINRLQFDIEQLRSKWLGLEAEIQAREEQTRKLNRELDVVSKRLSRKEALLKKRDQVIETLKSEIREHEDDYLSLQTAHDQLEQQIADEMLAAAELKETLGTANARIEELETEVDILRDAQQRAIEKDEQTERKLTEQQQALQISQETLTELETYIDARATRWDTQQAAIRQLQQDSEYLRKELTAARADVETRDDSIRVLQQDNEALHRQMEAASNAEVEQTQRLLSEQAGQIASDVVLIAELRSRIERSEAYADSLRQQLQDRIEEAANLKNIHDAMQKAVDRSTVVIEELQLELAEQHQTTSDLRQQLQDRTEESTNFKNSHSTMQKALDDATAAADALRQELAEQQKASAALQGRLDTIEQRHEEELRTVRFELGEAQNTISEHESINEQLTSDLIDTRGFRIQLENMISQSEEKHQKQIEALEQQIRALTGQIEDYEQKLSTKSEAINCLLTELAKKTEQVESIGQIEKVIHEIDNRMSQRIDDRPGGDRITRVLIGNIDGQVLRFPLFKNRLTIGRTPQNDIQLSGTYVSRRHALVVIEGDTARIVDWGSKNGVFVNSAKVSEHVLQNGDIVSIGTAKFRYEERPKRDS